MEIKKLVFSVLLLLAILFVLGHGERKYVHSNFIRGMREGDKAAKLIVHFDNTHADTRQLIIDVLNEKAKLAFPEFEIREAYISRIVIRWLGKKGVVKHYIRFKLHHKMQDVMEKKKHYETSDHGHDDITINPFNNNTYV